MGQKLAKLIADETSFKCDDLSVIPLQSGNFIFEIDAPQPLEMLSAECAQALAIWILMRSGAEIASVEAVDENIRVRLHNGKRPGS